MIQNILLCTDGSKYATIATEYALWLAKRVGASLSAVHVTDIRLLEWPLLADLSGSIGAQPYLAALPQVQKYHEEKSRVVLDGVVQLAKKQGVPCRCIPRKGTLTESILEEETDMDLVVLGQRGEHAEQTGDMTGSSMERIVRRSAKPCLVTPNNFLGITHMLLAYDGSESAGRALRQGTDLASTLGLPMTIISVAGKDSTSARTHLQEGLALAKQRGLSPRGELLNGDAEVEILNFAEREKMNLIVMGAYGHSRIREFILGSTTSHVIRKSRAPVLLVR